MELYTDSRPSLISERVAHTFDKMISDLKMQNRNVITRLYEDIICPNIGLTIAIVIILIFLIYRYYHNKHKSENFNYIMSSNGKHQLGIMNANERNKFGGMDDFNERIARPTFNPSIPVSNQQSYVNYMPDQIPLLLNGELINNEQSNNYNVPMNDVNRYQYTGPFYRSGENGLSDDAYKEFVEYSNNNLNDYNEILQQKINI